MHNKRENGIDERRAPDPDSQVCHLYTYEYAAVILVQANRSSRWSSGNPRMLLVLVREFESHRGEILNLPGICKKKKGSTAEST